MPARLPPLGALVHPHQIEVQDFAWYALVIDARRREAYDEDRVPGAVSIPVQTSEGGPKHDGTIISTRLQSSSRATPIPDAVAPYLAALPPAGPILIYCDRGGLDSLVWAEPLRAAGWLVDVLGGGWVNYRRWVEAGLEVLPRVLTFRHLVAPPVSGLCRILSVLESNGEQVLDVADLAGQRLIPGLSVHGDVRPSQSGFETRLLDTLRHFDSKRPVWVRSGPAPLQHPVLPPPLRDALRAADVVALEVPLAERARAWFERLQTMRTPIAQLLDALRGAAPPPPPALMAQWTSMSTAGDTVETLSAIINTYIDPHNKPHASATAVKVLALASLECDALARSVAEWLCSQRFGVLSGSLR